VSWAHPEFGQILASCAGDGCVHIYEEVIDRNNRSLRRFTRKALLVDNTQKVTDLQFAPRHLGLKLAACSEDGRVKVYTCENFTTLTQWQPQEFSPQIAAPCQALSWSPSPFDAPALAIASGNAVEIWEYQDTARKWLLQFAIPHPQPVHHVDWAPQMGRSFHLLATACKDRKLRVFKLTPGSTPDSAVTEVKVACQEATREISLPEVWRVAWNATGSVLASAGDDGAARLWRV
jgi:nucleoporin SEH1